MSERPIEKLPPHGRRQFFTAGFARLIGSISEVVEKRLPFELPQYRPVLRPPGALPEKDFLATCFRSGSCADACPAHAIALRTADAGESQRGTPYIDPDLSACVVCDELACMKVCPSGALRLVGRLHIRIGLARLSEKECLRSGGENCTICIDRCPLGETAIRIDDGRVRVSAPADDGPERLGEGCVGCGICQYYCPTTPKAIVIEPL